MSRPCSDTTSEPVHAWTHGLKEVREGQELRQLAVEDAKECGKGQCRDGVVEEQSKGFDALYQEQAKQVVKECVFVWSVSVIEAESSKWRG